MSWIGALKTVLVIGAFAASGASLSAKSVEQSALNPASPQAFSIDVLWWLMFWVSLVALVGTLAVLAIGLWRARRAGNQQLSAVGSRNLVLVAGLAIPLVVLVSLVGGSLILGKELSAEPPANALTIEVTGWRWWWQVRYLDSGGEPMFTTANELHIPVGRPVKVSLRAADVIHSFWVPNLHGKTDLVPGHVNNSWFQASQAGVFRGQCAEYCGTQHALMAFLVIAEPEAEFERWLENQKRPAPAPQTAAARLGQQVFMDKCSHCHNIRGTQAEGQGTDGIVAPDLTHFGSRRTLAAATKPSSRGHIAGWVSDSQSIKPGNFMPPIPLTPEHLTAVTTYLESLK